MNSASKRAPTQSVSNPAARHRSSSKGEPLRQDGGQAGVADFLLRGAQVVFEAADVYGLVGQIVNRIGCTPVPVARLADTSDVDEIFHAAAEAGFHLAQAAHRILFFIDARNVGVAVKAELG